MRGLEPPIHPTFGPIFKTWRPSRQTGWFGEVRAVLSSKNDSRSWSPLTVFEVGACRSLFTPVLLKSWRNERSPFGKRPVRSRFVQGARPDSIRFENHQLPSRAGRPLVRFPSLRMSPSATTAATMAGAVVEWVAEAGSSDTDSVSAPL
jgi:hypothetical protein